MILLTLRSEEKILVTEIPTSNNIYEETIIFGKMLDSLSKILARNQNTGYITLVISVPLHDKKLK